MAMLAPTMDSKQIARIKREAEASINKLDLEPIVAEIREDSKAKWYFVKTFDDARALRHLARRRFAAFLAMRSGGAAGEDAANVRSFAGWILVYVFDIEKMLDRLLATPGIEDILCHPFSGKPMPIDQGLVDDAKALFWKIRRHQPVKVPDANPQQPSKPRRASRNERKVLERLKKAMKAAGLAYNDQQWTVINRLEPRMRIAVLEQTLRPLSVSLPGAVPLSGAG